MSLGAEEKYCPDADAKDLVLFPLNDITSECFQKIIAWMREHHGWPTVVLAIRTTYTNQSSFLSYRPTRSGDHHK
jgi:hypothetical protein